MSKSIGPQFAIWVYMTTCRICIYPCGTNLETCTIKILKGGIKKLNSTVKYFFLIAK